MDYHVWHYYKDWFGDRYDSEYKAAYEAVENIYLTMVEQNLIEDRLLAATTNRIKEAK